MTAGEEIELAFGGPLVLEALDGKPFEIQHAKLAIGADAARLAFHVGGAAYRELRDRALFNLHPIVRGDADVAGAGEVTVKARLRPELFAEITAAEPEAIATALAGGTAAGVLAALRATESWLAESVTEPIEPPPELGVTGTVSTGYQTAWARGELDVASRALRDVATGVLAEYDWPTEVIGDSLVRVEIEGEHAAWVLLVRFDDAAQLCTLASIHPDAVPPERRVAVATFFAARNRDVTGGAFDLDPEDGEVRLRSTVFAGTPAPAFERAILANLRAFAAHAEVLAALFRGELDPDAAMAQLA